jgi:uncharacterized cupin superfamily protein
VTTEAHELSGAVTRDLAIANHGGPGDPGPKIALRGLQKSFAACGKIAHQLRDCGRNAQRIDEIEVGAHTQRDLAAIAQAHVPGIATREHFDDAFRCEASITAIPCPVT